VCELRQAWRQHTAYREVVGRGFVEAFMGVAGVEQFEEIGTAEVDEVYADAEVG